MSRAPKAATGLDKDIGISIRAQRRAKGWTQERIAAATGISYQQIQKYENGTSRVSASRLAEIGQALGCGVAWFFPKRYR